MAALGVVERGEMAIARRDGESLDDWYQRAVRECTEARHAMRELDEGNSGEKTPDEDELSPYAEAERLRARWDAAREELLLAFDAWRFERLPEHSPQSAAPASGAGDPATLQHASLTVLSVLTAGEVADAETIAQTLSHVAAIDPRILNSAMLAIIRLLLKQIAEAENILPLTALQRLAADIIG